MDNSDNSPKTSSKPQDEHYIPYVKIETIHRHMDPFPPCVALGQCAHVQSPHAFHIPSTGVETAYEIMHDRDIAKSNSATLDTSHIAQRRECKCSTECEGAKEEEIQLETTSKDESGFGSKSSGSCSSDGRCVKSEDDNLENISRLGRYLELDSKSECQSVDYLEGISRLGRFLEPDTISECESVDSRVLENEMLRINHLLK